jgi:RNA polymerase sigma-70 factor, ECF subfamily
MKFVKPHLSSLLSCAGTKDFGKGLASWTRAKEVLLAEPKRVPLTSGSDEVSVELIAQVDATTAENKEAARTPTDPDLVLVAAAKNGKHAAFEALLERYERRIFRLAQNVTQNREDAEEVMQDTFMRAFTHLGSFPGESRFYTWLTRIAINEALMKLRRRRPTVSLDDEGESENDSFAGELEDWGPSPEKRYSQWELQQILSEAMGQLSPGLRLVTQLRDIERFSVEETAQILGLSLSAVKSRSRRARATLREILNQYFRQLQKCETKPVKLLATS